jgi:hypothetical protein
MPKIAVLLVTMVFGAATLMASAANTSSGSASPAAAAALPAITQSTFTVDQCYTSCVLTLPSHAVGGMSCVFANTSANLAPSGISNTAGFSWSPWIGSVGIGEDTVWASCAPTLTTASSDTVTVSFPATDYINGILWADVSNVSGIDNSVAVGQLTYGTPTLSFPVTGSNDIVIAIVFIVDGSLATSGPGYSLFPTLGTGGANSTWGTDTWVEYKVITGSPAVVTASDAVSGYNITAVALKSLSTGTPTAANVTFSPVAGSYSSAQNVTLSTTAGTVICYNTTGSPATNGSTGCTSGTQYTGPVSVPSSETLYAVAGGTGYTDSSVSSAAYTINLTSAQIAISGTSVSVVPGATTGNTSTITVTPSGGFTGSVALTASITSSPTGSQNLPTLSFGSTTPVNITGFSSGTAILTITTTAATSSALTYPKRPGAPWYAGGSALACLVLMVIPARRRRGRAMLGMLALMVALSSGVLACGGSLGSGGGSGGGGGGGTAGTTAGTYTITVTGTSGTLSQTGAVTLTVQ